MRAFILIKVKPKNTAKVMQELKEIPEVLGASFIHGPHDCLIEARGEILQDINDVVIRIRGLKGVQDTITCLVVQSWKRAG